MPNTRRGNKLTPSQSTLKNSDQVEHLDPTSDTHLIDVASAERQRNKESAEAATAEVALLNKPFSGFGLRPDLVANIWFGDSGVGFTDLNGHDGSAMVMEGKEWQRAIMRADTGRFKWRDGSDKLRRPQGLELLIVAEKPKTETSDKVTGEDAEETPEEVSAKPGKGPRMSGQLAKIYARLPPWVALEAGKELTREQLVEVATRVANAFQIETGRRALAANIHVESDHDIHLHLAFTALVPEISEKKYSGDYIKKILAKQRKQVKVSLLKSGNEKPSRKQIQAGLDELYATGELTHPELTKEEVIYRRLPRPKANEGRRNLLSMGPAYCSKTTLWDASGRDPQVAKVNENVLAKAFSFGEVVVAKVKKSSNPKMKDLGPEDHYIDYWLWKTWKDTVEGVLAEKTREQLPELAMPFVQRYIQDGKSLPNPVLDAARRKAEQESFDALDKARKTLAGSAAPPTAAATIPDLVDEIAVIIADNERRATQARTALDEAVNKEKAAARLKTRAERELLQASADRAAVDSEFTELAAAKQELAVENHLLQCREEKIVELEQKAGHWDRVVPMIQGMVRMLPEKLQNLVTTSLANDPGDTVPDSKINSWIHLCARLARLAMTKSPKAKDIGKDGAPTV